MALWPVAMPEVVADVLRRSGPLKHGGVLPGPE
jgi:hypothetical protein